MGKGGGPYGKRATAVEIKEKKKHPAHSKSLSRKKKRTSRWKNLEEITLRAAK